MSYPVPLSSELINSGSNLTVPSNCTSIICLANGAGTPTLGGVAMTAVTTRIWRMDSPPVGSVAVTVQGGRFVYCTNLGVLDGTANGYASSGLGSYSLPATTQSIVFGVLIGSTGTASQQHLQSPNGTDFTTYFDHGNNNFATAYFNNSQTPSPITVVGRDDGSGGTCTQYFAGFQYLPDGKVFDVPATPYG